MTNKNGYCRSPSVSVKEEKSREGFVQVHSCSCMLIIDVVRYNYSDFCWDECLKVTLTWL
jgi:hypothetical protein